MREIEVSWYEREKGEVHDNVRNYLKISSCQTVQDMSHGSGHKAWAVEERSWITPENLSPKDQMKRGNTKEIFSMILSFSLGQGLYYLMISSTFIPTESNSTPEGGCCYSKQVCWSTLFILHWMLFLLTITKVFRKLFSASQKQVNGKTIAEQSPECHIGQTQAMAEKPKTGCDVWLWNTQHISARKIRNCRQDT